MPKEVNDLKIYNNHSGSTGKLTTSKGNQIKMKIDGFWYKMDYLGYEGLSEYLCSELLPYTNISSYVKYEMVEMSLNSETFNGCKSKDFLKEKEEIVTAARLFQSYIGKSVDDCLTGHESLKEKISFFVNTVESITGIENYGKHLTQILEWDSFVLNDDRHFNNIAFIYNPEKKSFSPCTLFDNGAAFLSDLRFDYPLEKNFHGLIANVSAKPFHKSFDKQIKACEELYGKQFVIDPNIHISPETEENIRQQYGDRVANRVYDIFEHQKWMTEYISVNKKTKNPLDSVIDDAIKKYEKNKQTREQTPFIHENDVSR